MVSFWSAVVRGAAAGAAGTTALNAVTYLDMAVRGRPASSTPEETVEKLAHAVHTEVPGDDETRSNRLSGLGPLTGIATGVAVGAVAGLIARSSAPGAPRAGSRTSCRISPTASSRPRWRGGCATGGATRPDPFTRDRTGAL